MSTTYNFKVCYFKGGIAYNPLSSVTVSVGDGTNTLSSNSVTTLTTITGERRFSYVGIDNLNLSALFHTDDALCDKQDIFVEPNDTVPDNSDVLAIKAQTDQLTFTVPNELDVNVIDWKSEVAPSVNSEIFTSGTNYFIGDLVTISFTFKNSSGALVDPSTVEFELEKPDLTKVTYVYGTDAELVKDSTGTYHVAVDAETAGKYTYYYVSTGTGQSSGAGTFNISDPFTPLIQPPLF